MSDLTQETRVARVREVLAAARRLADARDPLGIAARRLLPGATGLTLEGVELAMTRCLETDATPGELAQLVARAGEAERVHVVLSANVFIGVVRAVALAVAAAPIVYVRPSAREAVMAPLLARALDERNAGVTCRIVGRLEASAGDEVHVYGRSETIDRIAAGAPEGVRVRGHGPGFGAAFVGTGVSLAVAAERLSWDIAAFDQRGCLSPRIAFVQGGEVEVHTFAEQLAGELGRRGHDVPRGSLTDDERQAQALYRQTMHAVGECREGSSFTVGIALESNSLVLPPPGRSIHVVRAESPHEVTRLVAPFAADITCIGHGGESPALRLLGELAPRARRLPLGQMQRPPFDGPVDLRDVKAPSGPSAHDISAKW